MSTHICPVVRIKKSPHPNADSLSIMEIMGYEVALRSDDWEDGQLAVHIPPDYWVPDTYPFQFLKPTSTKWQRTRTKKFRGRYSYGFLIPLPEELNLQVGDNAMEALGIIRYEAPENTFSGDNESAPEGIYPKYDIENYQRYTDLLVDGETQVIVTEKIHGANARFVFTDGRMRAGTRTQWKKRDSTCMWWRAVEQNPWIEEWCTANPDITIYGEVFGNVQNLKYGAIGGQIFFRAFDLLQNGEWIDYTNSREIGKGIEWVPLVYSGPMNIELFSEIILGNTQLMDPKNAHMMEGVVIRPFEEMYDSSVGRVILKLVSPRYLEKN